MNEKLDSWHGGDLRSCLHNINALLTSKGQETPLGTLALKLSQNVGALRITKSDGNLEVVGGVLDIHNLVELEIEVDGLLVYTPNHAGVYVTEDLVLECPVLLLKRPVLRRIGTGDQLWGLDLVHTPVEVGNYAS